ncbi:MAG: isopenicillin N synthase family oxygenase [Acidimicrobiia bacterium]|nr:isopenicillin N synthase family oxygenase [Acidimicrobiia bacterium]
MTTDADSILDVDLLAFEQGSASQRRAVVDGVTRSLATGFVYTSNDVGEDLLDTAYGMLEEFFSLPPEDKARSIAPGTNGQTGYTGLLVETAASADVPDWKEMLNWGRRVPDGHPLRTKYPHRYHDTVLPENEVPGITKVLEEFHERVASLLRRFLRIIGLGLGADEHVFESAVADAPDLTRAIHYPPMTLSPGAGHVWAGEHGDINLITALPRASRKGLQVKTDGGWVDAVPPPGHAVINTGIMLDRISNGRIPIGVHRVVADEEDAGDRYSVVQFCHPTPWTILAPLPSCVSDDNPARHLPVDAGSLLDQVLWEINLVEDGRRVDEPAA